MIIDFKEVRHMIPWYIFNEYGQLTGNYVHFDKVICERENGRLKVWLNQEAFDAKDPERLICDYDESILQGINPKPVKEEKPPLKTDDEWKQQLTPEQYQVCRKKATEKPFSGEYYTNKEEGSYHCVCCGKELFSSETKYESGTGWPSFWSPVDDQSIKREIDNTLFTRRTEVLCNNCDSHLGHLFDDGPAPTYQRYCINSLSLKFVKKDRSEVE